MHEYPSTFSQGARIMAGFTGYQGKGLYWREEYAEYGRQSAHPLTLTPGDYKLAFAMAAWKATPKYKVSILDAVTGSTIASSEVFTATPNANGSTSANVSSAVQHDLHFTVSTAGNYVIRFTNESRSSSAYDEYLLLSCSLRIVGRPSAIRFVNAEGTDATTIHDLRGQRYSNLHQLRQGIYIRNGKKIFIR